MPAKSKVTIEVGDFYAPHSPTVRETYTVPTSRECRIESLFVEMAKGDTETTPGDGIVIIQYCPAAEATGIHLIALNALIPADPIIDRDFPQLTMLAGDKLVVYTANNATGGTKLLIAYASGTEYDA